MRYLRSVLRVDIRLDPVPGWGHQPEDHAKMLQDMLKNSIPHYNPHVELIEVENEPEAETKRVWKEQQR